MKKRFLLWVALGLVALLAAAVPVSYYISLRARGEHFYGGRPTSYWSRQVREWIKDWQRGQRWTPPWPERVLHFLRFRSDIRIPAVLQDVSPGLLPVLSDLVEDEDRDVRLWALRHLAVIDSDSSVIIAALGNGEQEVRFTAAVLLGESKSRNPDVMLALSHALGDNSVEVRHRAAYALVNLGPEAALPLVRVLDDPDKHIRQIAWYSLRKCGGGAKPAVPRLVEMALKEDDKDLRSIAAWVLEDIDPEAAGLAGIARR
jgi:HEAT repeat protein